MSAAVAPGTAAREWSPLQRACFDAVEAPGSHLVIEALAGSGKSTVIEECVHRTRDGESVLVCAFNKSIAQEMGKRLTVPGVEVLTLHGYGVRQVSRALGRLPLAEDKVAALARELIGSDWDSREARSVVVKLVGIAKNLLVERAEALDVAADAMGVDIPKGWDRARLVVTALRIVEGCKQPTGCIDFDDMIWLPVVRKLACIQYDWVFVDEAQDLNPCQLELIQRAVKPKGRIVLVGDRRQSIYGFRGADRQAIPRMTKALGAKVLPLSITYRCPRSVVTQAKRLVPALEAAAHAIDGVVRDATIDELKAKALPGDMVVSRTNAPLVSLAFQWIAQGRRAVIRGRDVGAGLAAWVRATNAQTIGQLSLCVRQWRAKEVARLDALERDTQHVEDKADCLEALCSACDTPAALLARIETLFADKGTEGAILLSSTHRAKGLEADRVWMLADTYRETSEEERNLSYVAITRAKKELIFAREEAPESKETPDNG